MQRNSGDFAEVRRIAESGDDHPVLMLNINRYARKLGFLDRGAYRDYIAGLDAVPDRRGRQAVVALSCPRP